MATKKGGRSSTYRRMRKPLLIVLTLALLTSACGGNFAQNLRTTLALAPPLIDSLVASGVIKPELRDTYLRDFTDLTAGAATLKENLDSCGSDKPCKLDAVDKYQQLFWDVLRRGHFSRIEKLQTIQTILAAIIAAAKEYYSPSVQRRDGSTEVKTDVEIKAGIARLKAEMEVK